MRLLAILVAALVFAKPAMADKSLISEKFESKMAEAIAKNLSEAKSVPDVFKINLLKKQDHEYVKNLKMTLSGKAVPKVTFKKPKSIVFSQGEHSVEVEFVSIVEKKVRINGYLADFSPYKTLSEQHRYAERILKTNSKKKTALLFNFFFLPEANALFPAAFLALVPGWLAYTAGGTATVYLAYQGIKIYKANSKEAEEARELALGQSQVQLAEKLKQGAAITDIECSKGTDDVIIRSATGETHHEDIPLKKVDSVMGGHSGMQTEVRVTAIGLCACDVKCKPKLIQAMNERLQQQGNTQYADSTGQK
jgi:hypothetical protein